jgi:hypothetical protein
LDTYPSHDLRAPAIKLLSNVSDDCKDIPSDLKLRNVEYDKRKRPTMGGFGDVYKGTYAGRPVAVKLIRPDNESDMPKTTKVEMARFLANVAND